MAEAAQQELNPGQRLFVAALLLAITIGLIRFMSNSWSFLNDGSGYNLIFVSAALLLVLGAYISEPFFTRPADAIVNAVALLVALLGVRDPDAFVGYWLVLGAAVLLLITAVIVVAPPRGKLPRLRSLLYRVATGIGRSAVVFPVLYVLVLATFFMNEPEEFWILATLLLLLVARRPVERLMLGVISALKAGSLSAGEVVGRVSSRLNPQLVAVHRTRAAWLRPGQLVEIPTVGDASMVAVARYDLHRASGVDTVVEIIADGTGAHAIGRDNVVRPIPLATPLAGEVMELRPDAANLLGIEDAHPDRLVGFVAPGSRIESLEVEVPESFGPRPDLKIGSVVTTEIGRVPHLYQVISAQTDEERIGGGDARGYTSFTAQPLGAYDAQTRQMKPPTWIPEIYSPVRLCAREEAEVPGDAIGRLPGTSLSVPILAPDELVTHNTAILGVLGVGKSSLTFELIKKLVQTTDVRVICIDVTNEYRDTLPLYLREEVVADDVNSFNAINENYRNRVPKDASRSGNIGDYRSAVRDDLRSFLFATPTSTEIDGVARVRIYNPDFHKVSRGTGFDAVLGDATQAEKARVLAEELFWVVQPLGQSGGKARVLLVFEEAHSLIPEWNAIAHDADRAASNGTAKVVLQGRKYGLGCLVIAQRTASVSKSVLNQCNTVFAMRIFDDTGKQFLENYVGQAFANALPTLEERHAVAVGRGLRAKRPLIVELNDLHEVRLPP